MQVAKHYGNRTSLLGNLERGWYMPSPPSPFPLPHPPCKGMHDSFGFWILRRGYRIPSTRSRIFGSGTWIPNIAIVRIPNSRIPDSTSTNFADSTFSYTGDFLTSQSIKISKEKYPILRLTWTLFLACLVTMCPHLSHHYKFLDCKQWMSEETGLQIPIVSRIADSSSKDLLNSVFHASKNLLGDSGFHGKNFAG